MRTSCAVVSTMLAPKTLLWKKPILVAALLVVSIVGPLTAYAAVTVIYPKSTHTVGISGTAPISFDEGADYWTARNASFANSWLGHDANASFTIDLNTLSGGNVTIGKYVHATASAGVSKFRMEIATAIPGGATLDPAEIVSLKIRLWTGGVEPTTDFSAGVCGVLNLESAVGNRTAYCPTGVVFMQSVFELGTDSAGTATVSIRPTDVVFV